MAIYGFTKILIPDQRMDEVAALLEQHGGSLHLIHDISEGGAVRVLRFTGHRVVDRPLTGH